MSYIGLFECQFDYVDLPKYIVCIVHGSDIENDNTFLDTNNSNTPPMLTAIYSDIKDKYFVVQQLEWTLGMFNDCGIVDSTTLCGDFSKKPPVCKYLGKDVELLGTRFDTTADKKLKEIMDLGVTYKLIHPKPLGDDTSNQLKRCLKKPSYIEHVGGIPSWGSKPKKYNGIGRRFNRALRE